MHRAAKVPQPPRDLARRALLDRLGIRCRRQRVHQINHHGRQRRDLPRHHLHPRHRLQLRDVGAKPRRARRHTPRRRRPANLRARLNQPATPEAEHVLPISDEVSHINHKGRLRLPPSRRLTSVLPRRSLSREKQIIDKVSSYRQPMKIPTQIINNHLFFPPRLPRLRRLRAKPARPDPARPDPDNPGSSPWLPVISD